MKLVNHETSSSVVNLSLQGEHLHKRAPKIVRCASFLTGTTLAVALGLTFALSTSAFAMGGGGGGGGPVPKVAKVEEPAPVTSPAPAASESKTRKPEEKSLAIDGPDEDKAPKKPDDRTTEFPKPEPEVVTATVEFGHGPTQIKEGEGADLKVVLSNAFSQPVTVQLSKEGDGLELSTSTVTFRAGRTEEVVRLTAVQDDDSIDERVAIYFGGSLPAGVTRGKARSHVVAVIDDDPVAPATVEFGHGPTQIKEGEYADLKVVLSNALSRPVTVQLSREGTALELSPGAVTFQPGDTEEIVRLTAVQDGDSNDETVTIHLGSSLPAGVTHGKARSHVVAVIDDDPFVPATVEFTHLNSVVNEGSSGNIQVELSKSLPQPVSFDVNIAASGTAVEGTDYRIPARLTITAGVTSLALTVINDADAEGDETITLTLSRVAGLPAGVIIGANSTHTVTIPANDNAVGFASSASTITEGGSTMTEILVTTVNPAPVDIALNVLPAGTATEGTDYTISAKSLVIPAGRTSGTITLTGIDDDIGEGDETVTLALEESATAPLPVGWELGVHTHVITIVDDDNDATVEFARGTTRIKEGETEDLKILLSRELSRPVTVQLPKVGDGLELSTSAVTFQPKQKEKIVKLTAVQDEDGDDEEATISLTLGGNSPAGVTYGGIHSHVVTIIDDDDPVVPATVVEFAQMSSVTSEGGVVNLKLELSRPAPAGGVTLSLECTGTASAADFVGLSSEEVTFPEGTQVATVTFTVKDDGIAEPEETFVFTFDAASLPAGVTIGAKNTHTLTIPASDQQPEFAPATVKFAARESTVNEGDDVELQVELSKALPQTVTLDLNFRWWGAWRDDIVSFPSTVTFPQGETTASVNFTVKDDTIEERNEDFTVVLRYIKEEFRSYVQRGVPRRHTVTIIDDDIDVEVGFSTEYSRVNEGDSLRLGVRLSRPLPQPLTLSVVGSAGSENDITIPDPLTFEQGETLKHFEIETVDDSISEGNEIVTLSLEGELPDGASFGIRSSTFIIFDDDVDAEVGFSGRAHSQAYEGGRFHLVVGLSRPLPQPLTLSVVGSAGSDDDIIIPGPLTFEQGETFKHLEIETVDDSIFEGDETVTLSLEGELPDDARFDTRLHTVTIIDNDAVDATVGFTESTSEMVEGNLSVQVTISTPLPQALTLAVDDVYTYYGYHNGIHVYNKGIHVPRTLTFEPGETDKYLEISTGDNNELNDGETFQLVLEESWSSRFPNGLRFGTRTHTVTFIDERVTVGFAKPITHLNEGVGSVAVEVLLSEALSEPLEVSLAYPGGLYAKIYDNIDVYTHSRSITFQPGETSKSFLFDIADDRWIEGGEHGLIALSGDLPEGVRFGRKLHSMIFNDNDNAANGGAIQEDTPPSTEPVAILEAVNVKVGDVVEIINENPVDRIEALNHSYSEDATRISIENLNTVDTDIIGRNRRPRNTGDVRIKNARQGVVGGNVIGKHHGSGLIDVENWGRVDGDMRTVHFKSGEIKIANYENVGDDIEATHYGSGKISIENEGTVGHRIDAKHYGDSQILITNHETGTATAIEARHYGSGEISIVNRGTAVVTARHEGDNGVVRFEGKVNENFINELTGGAIHLGVVDFERGAGETTLEIFGDYEGSNDTRLNFHVGPDGTDYGYLWIEGNVTERSRVSLIVDGEVAADADFDLWQLIEVEGNASSNSFYGAEVIGAFDYVLEYERGGTGDHAWHFVNRGLSETATQSSQTVDEIIKNMTTPTAANPGRRAGNSGRPDDYWCLWGEQLGSHTVLGFDVPVTRLMGGNVFVGTSVAHNSSTSNNISVESQITALSADWEHNGFYVGGQTQLARFTSDVSTGRLSVVRDNGGTGISTSMETGYRFNVTNNFQISPQTELTWTRVGFDDFVGPHGEVVSLEDGDVVTGSLGLLWNGEWQGEEGFGRLYGEMNLRGNLDGKTSVNVSGTSIVNDQKDFSVDGKLGASYEWNEGYTVRGEVSTLRNDDAEEIRANLGMRIDF
ncbi:MAG: autotransporter outer membrane beta-barrel domain-containing protein [Hyphomicrobiales bacterium]|nr:autotransporter outer membrane beta-barrel domain-containing protein [Hyphomicrobiales bacterium]